MSVDLTVPQFIISSMMAAKQLRQQKARDAASIEGQKAETDLARQKHEQQAKEFDDMQKHLKLQNQAVLAGIDAQKMHTQAQQQANHIQLLQAYRRGEVKPTSQVSVNPMGDALAQRMGQPMLNGPSINIGGQEMSLEGGVSPEEAAQQKASDIKTTGAATSEVAGNTAGAVAAATEPYNINKFNREQAGRENIEGMQAYSNETIASGHNAAQKIIADEHNKMLKYLGDQTANNNLIIAGMHYQGAKSDKVEARNKFRIAAAAGDLPIDLLQPAEREFVLPDLVASGGFYTSAQLKDAGVAGQALNALKTLKEISDQIAQTNPAKGNYDAMGRNAKMFVEQSDLYKRFNETAALVSGLGRAMGERGAFSNQDRAVYAKALIGLDKSDSANAQSITDLSNLFYKKASDALPEAKPELSKKILKTKFGIDPPSGGYSRTSFADSLPPTNSVGHKLDKDKSNLLNKPVYYQDQ